MAGLFYTTREKRMMAEGLYRQVIDFYGYGKPGQQNNYNLVMALNFYGRMLLDSNPRRKSEAEEYLNQSEVIQSKLAPWQDKIDNVYMPHFELV